MIQVAKQFWLVHIYEQGRYLQTVDEIFTEERAANYCKSFNSERSIFVAVAKPHVLRAEVDADLGVAEERR